MDRQIIVNKLASIREDCASVEGTLDELNEILDSGRLVEEMKELRSVDVRLKAVIDELQEVKS